MKKEKESVDNASKAGDGGSIELRKELDASKQKCMELQVSFKIASHLISWQCHA